ncbi:CHAT domain-containing protein [Sphingomonas sp. S2-65]|uniref:CHAT domain-containing protein n=1 Tax=Sphingomonas sp. S2-65 TaxID=2903960 RepID=UPI001F43731B|nr:CHAT domain-containing protein [Sphingomonas sp. S2-65]UYY57201.1 CHAT domain-containing protein [Sphingomonas sp. S2-65]
MRSSDGRMRPLIAATAMAAALAGCSSGTRPRAQLDTVSLGRNAADEACVASRTWRDAGVRDMFDSAYLITCRNVTASRPLGAVRVVAETPEAIAPVEALFACGTESTVTVAGAPARVRRCTDKTLQLDTVRIDMAAGDKRVIANATPALLAQLEEAAAVLAGRRKADADPRRELRATIDLTALPAGPSGTTVVAVDENAGAAFDPALALRQGTQLNHNGRHAEASRLLNDAISRLPANFAADARAELLLEAGLADSNISFSDSAQQRFAQADALIGQAGVQRAAFLQRKRDAYVSLDLLNRREFAAALQALDRLVSAEAKADQPLMDVSTIRQLNQTRPERLNNAVAVPDTRQLSQLVIDAQANWARSVALLALGQEARANAALDASSRAYRALLGEPIDPTQSLWLGARIERQRGRLAAQRGDWSTALNAFDRALQYLQRSAVGSLGTGSEPAIAEAQLERAGVLARSGAPAAQIRHEYAAAVDALVASNGTGSILPTGLENYLDLLVAESRGKAQADTYELFFRAVQAGGQPGVARQLNQLQNIVSADPELANLVRSRATLEREVTRLRYAIADKAETPGESIGDLEGQRRRAEEQLIAVNDQLARNQRFRSVDDSPATLAAVRAALGPDEGYLKLYQLSNRAYGIYVTRNRTFIYPVVSSAKQLAELDGLANSVRRSVDGRLGEGQLVPYDAGGAHVLFRLIAGPAREEMLKTASLVVDPAGPLTLVPIGALVTEYAPKAVGEDPFDFSQVSFLAARTTVSTALSPRSFLVSRALAGSKAPHALLGFGAHLPPVGDALADRMVDVGFACTVPYRELAAISRAFAPIDRRELDIAAEALGDPQAPLITAAGFTDTAIEQRSDLDEYQVIHFATHGLQEGQWGCAKSPPALVTSFGGAQSDGLLSFSEIAQLRLNANLVVLSACDTIAGVRNQALARASGQEESGATLEGLVRAFLAANARSVLATYWQVSAEAESQNLIRAFYGAARTQTIGRALQTAQRTLMEQPKFSHPFYWAPYFLVGDSTKTMLSNPPGPATVAQR